MQIFIKTLTGKTFSLDVDDRETVFEMMVKIQDKEGIPPEQQRLFSPRGAQMNVLKTLFEYEIEKEQTLKLVIRLRGGMFHQSSGRDGGFRTVGEEVRGITLEGAVNIHFRIRTDAHVDWLREQLAELGCSGSRLIFNGVPMEGGRTLADYGVSDGDMITVED